MPSKETAVLVAYFSHTGQNYLNGKIADLKKGNTEIAAEIIAELTGGGLLKLRTKKDYPFVYGECTDIAKQELRANSRPELEDIGDISGYDTIILGFPCWWGTMPMAVWTFLETRNFAGKTVLPFCTHEGSGMGVSERDLRKLCPDADIRAGLPIFGSLVSEAKPAIERWLEKNV